MKNGIIHFEEELGIDHIVCCYSDRGVQQLADVFCQRAERAQYMLLKGKDPGLTWVGYLKRLYKSTGMQERVRCVVLRAQRDFPWYKFDFDAPPKKAYIGGRRGIRLLGGESALAFVLLFLLKAEKAHCRRLSSERPGYSLEQYMRELGEQGETIAALRRGFEAAVDRLDFCAAWLAEGYWFEADE